MQAAAKRRLIAMVEPVLDAFDEILATWRGTRCEACGRPTGDPMPVIRIGQLVLDRTGFHPTLTVEHAAPNEFEGMDVFAIADHAEEIARTARALADAEAARLLPAAEDGFIVPDDERPDGDERTDDELQADVTNPEGNVTPDNRPNDEEGPK